MFSVVVNIDGLARKLDTFALRADDLEKPLAQFGAYLRRRALARYEAQAFPPLAESTIEARTRKAIHSVERKLTRELGRADKRAKNKAASSGVKDAFIAAHQSAKSRGVRNRLAVLAEMQRRFKRNWSGRTTVDSMGLQPLSIKQMASLDARVQRAVDRAESRPILGQLPHTLVVDVSGGAVTLMSRTHEKWSAAHNEGASVGNGAQLPKRETVVLEPRDVDVLIAILKSYLLMPFEEGVHGPAF